MQQVIITTNFSDASRNAMAYLCSMMHGRETDFELLLLHIYTIPIIYTGDVVGLSGPAAGLEDIQEQLEEELNWLKGCNPALHVRGRIMLGGFMEAVRDQIRELQPALLVMGVAGHYDDLWSWDNVILNALRDLPVPVLTIPKQLQYRPVKQVAYACNYRNVSSRTPVEAVQQIIRFTGAELHVIHVHGPARQDDVSEEQGKHLLAERLGEVPANYHTLEDKRVVEAIARYLEAEEIDLLIVVPKRHGIWADLFHKSNTKALARLNKVPVLALRELA